MLFGSGSLLLGMVRLIDRDDVTITTVTTAAMPYSRLDCKYRPPKGRSRYSVLIAQCSASTSMKVDRYHESCWRYMLESAEEGEELVIMMSLMTSALYVGMHKHHMYKYLSRKSSNNLSSSPTIWYSPS